MSDQYTRKEKIELLTLARRTIADHLACRPRDYGEPKNPKFLEKRGVFVTLDIHGQLRGCIGYPLPTASLYQAVIDNAISSANEDPRFPPVKAHELADIDIEISILTVPQRVAGPQDVKVGRDGIIISKGYSRGLLLPQVPVEQGWNLEEYISYGCRKAGLSPDEWRKGVDIETFQAIVFGEKELLKKGE